MKTRILKACAAAAVILVTSLFTTDSASAFLSYNAKNMVPNTVIKTVYLHTVGALCPNATWTGLMNYGVTINKETSFVCMVYRAEAWDTNNGHYGGSARIGQANGTTWVIYPGGEIDW